MAYILAGDVGATKVLLQVYDTDNKSILAEKRYLSRDFSSLSLLIQAFQAEYAINTFHVASLGLPGHVEGRTAQLTNLPWRVDADEIESTCQISHVEILNDFYAAALGIDDLSSTDLICLQQGQFEPEGNRLVIGAGSGLGVSPVKNCNGIFIPQASEGGHIDFAPVNEKQMEILRWLHKKWSHVSYERLLSGEGLETLYFFYSLEAHGHGKKSIVAADIEKAAFEGESIAIKTLQTFIEVYGAYIGNAALIWEASAGIYIAGGIAPKVKEWMERPEFIHAYLNKGRMTKVVENFPIYLVVNEQVGLLGNMMHAQQLEKQSAPI